MKGLGRGTAWMTASQVLRMLAQAATFVIVARTLGARGFGAFAAALALVCVAAPFAALGTGNLLVLHVARRPQSFARRFGAALASVPATALPLGLGVAVVGLVLLPALPVTLVLALAAAELLFGRFAELAAQGFQAHERMRATALLSVLPALLRLAAAAAFGFTGTTGPLAWALFYAGASAAAGGVGVVVAVALLGRPASFRLADLRGGASFAFAQSAANVYTDIDKTLLARLGSLQAAGVYAVAYRATAFAFAPVTALLTTTYARFFRRGEAGIHGSRGLARELLPFAAAYGLFVGIVLYAGAPLLPVVLGGDYGDAADALRWLAPLPLIQVFLYLGGDALTGAGYQRVRTWLQLVTAALNAGLCVALVPAYSWRGASWATLASLSLLAVALWAAVAVISLRKELGADARTRLAGVRP
jgi:O-antigen/teichoic acid export membrane protein